MACEAAYCTEAGVRTVPPADIVPPDATRAGIAVWTPHPAHRLVAGRSRPPRSALRATWLNPCPLPPEAARGGSSRGGREHARRLPGSPGRGKCTRNDARPEPDFGANDRRPLPRLRLSGGVDRVQVVDGSFFDTFPLHQLTTSPDETRRRNPEGSQDVRRFGPNFLVATGDSRPVSSRRAGPAANSRLASREAM
jgi:hypothetical protein